MFLSGIRTIQYGQRYSIYRGHFAIYVMGHDLQLIEYALMNP